MYHFCTYFDSNYLLRGITLYRSLLHHCEIPFRFYMLCLDQDTFDVLMEMDEDEIVPIKLADVEAWDPELLVAKGNRSLIEYYFTLSPILPLFVLENYEVDIVTYLDADLMFFSSPRAIYDELGDASVLITKHGFPDKLRHLEEYGVFNVQCQSFRGNLVGFQCLNSWRKQCLNWCYDRFEDDKYADQKYLDEWPALYGDALVISKHAGIGVAPWNIDAKDITAYGDEFVVDGKTLVFFHFHGFKQLRFNFIRAGFGECGVSGSLPVRSLYRAYFTALKENQKQIDAFVIDGGVRLKQGFFKLLYVSIREGDLLWLP